LFKKNSKEIVSILTNLFDHSTVSEIIVPSIVVLSLTKTINFICDLRINFILGSRALLKFQTSWSCVKNDEQ